MKVQTFEEIATMAALDSGFMLSTHYGQKTGQPMPVSDSRTIIRFARAMRLLGMREAAKICESRSEKYFYDSGEPDACAAAIREAAMGKIAGVS